MNYAEKKLKWDVNRTLSCRHVFQVVYFGRVSFLQNDVIFLISLLRTLDERNLLMTPGYILLILCKGLHYHDYD